MRCALVVGDVKKAKVFVSSKFNMAQESDVAPNTPHTIFTEF